MKLQNKDLFDHRIGAVDSSAGVTSEDLATRQVQTYPVPYEEARTRGREGPRTSAGAAISARDISVGEVAQWPRPPPVAKCCIPDNKINKQKIKNGITLLCQIHNCCHRRVYF